MQVYRNYVDGHWTESESGELMYSVNPATGQKVLSSQKSSGNDTKAAIDASGEVYERLQWRDDPSARAKALWRLAEKMRGNVKELATLMTLENGKLLRDSQGELLGTIDILEFYAGLARAVYGRSVNLSPTSMSVLLREPLGVVGVIVPWNGPMILMIRSLAPALAAGNVALVKPASITSGVTMEFAKMVDATEEIPKGVINFITGPGGIVGEEMAENPKVNMISFTGDSGTGKRIMEKASSHLKKVSLELGGKSPNVILEDADYTKAVRGAITGAAFRYASQICYAGTRLLVQSTVHEKMKNEITQIVRGMKVGDGMRNDTEIPPVVSEAQMERVLSFIETGKEHAELVTGGRRLKDEQFSRGYFVEPTIFDRVAPESPLAQQEIFGPVLSIIPFGDDDDAVRIANQSHYGLAAAIWTNDVNRAWRLAKRIKAGTVWINTYGNIRAPAEFPGYKESGLGTMLGLEGLLECTQMKNINFEIG